MAIMSTVLCACTLLIWSGNSYQVHKGIGRTRFPARLHQLGTVLKCAESPSRDQSNVALHDTVLTAAKISKENLSASYLAISILLLVFVSNQWCRQSLLYLCNFADGSDQYKHINAALQFGKEQYSTIASLGFTVPFAVLSIIAGQLTDKWDRRSVITAACAVWSVTTALHSIANTYSQLVPLRIIVGASQAFFNPAAFTLVADMFPVALAGTMSSVLSSGIFLGGAVASLSVVLDETVGWRITMAATGGVGLIAALCAWVVVRDPRSGKTQESPSGQLAAQAQQQATPTQSSWIDSLKDVFSTQEARLLFAASALRFCAGFSIIVWKAPFVFAKFPDQVAAFAGSNALVVGVGGLLSSLAGGCLSDRVASAGGLFGAGRAARAWVPAVGSLLAAPCWAGFVLATTPEQAAGCLLLEYLAAECWFGPTLASIFAVVPMESRGSAQGAFSVLTALGCT
jgi:predicted MFS family arabinose efflux permease